MPKFHKNPAAIDLTKSKQEIIQKVVPFCDLYLEAGEQLVLEPWGKNNNKIRITKDPDYVRDYEIGEKCFNLVRVELFQIHDTTNKLIGSTDDIYVYDNEFVRVLNEFFDK